MRRFFRPARQTPPAEVIRAELIGQGAAKHDERRGPQ